MTFIVHDLEKKCRKLVDTSRIEMPDDPTVPIIREVALTLDHLDRSRKTKESLLRKITEMASVIDDRILNIRRLPHEYSPSQVMEKDSFCNQLRTIRLRIEANRRTICMDYDKEVQRLHDRLLTSWNKHEMLHVDHDDQDYS